MPLTNNAGCLGELARKITQLKSFAQKTQIDRMDLVIRQGNSPQFKELSPVNNAS